MNRWLVNKVVVSPNRNDRQLPISMVVLHYTGMRTAGEALARLCDPSSQVSAHYLIDEDGTVTNLVPEEKRAWHAGKAYWRGITDVNSASIGIELVNPGHEFGYRPFPEPQMDALLPLLADIMDRHDIARANVVGHSDVAPARKIDPGEYFDWARLGQLGLALEIPKAKMNLFYDNPGAAAHLACPLSRSNKSSNRMPPISPSISPSMYSGRQRRWNARTTARPSVISYPNRSSPR